MHLMYKVSNMFFLSLKRGWTWVRAPSVGPGAAAHGVLSSVRSYRLLSTHSDL